MWDMEENPAGKKAALPVGDLDHEMAFWRFERPPSFIIKAVFELMQTRQTVETPNARTIWYSGDAPKYILGSVGFDRQFVAHDRTRCHVDESDSEGACGCDAFRLKSGDH